MKKLIICTFLLSLVPPVASASWGTEYDTVEVLYDNGLLKEQHQTRILEWRDSMGKYGFYRSWHENGQPEWEGQHWRDAKTGTWVRWDSTGRKIEEVSYVGGQKHGNQTVWGCNEWSFEKILHYRNGKLHGLCSWRKPNITDSEASNNPILSLDTQSFYLFGKVLVNVSYRATDTSRYADAGPGLKNASGYNEELDLWWEWAFDMSVGRKVDGTKDGIWVTWSKGGDMTKIESYDKGKLLGSYDCQTSDQN